MLTILCGLVSGILNAIAIISLLSLLALAQLSISQTFPILKAILMLCTMTLALAMALHLIPGFSNPIVLNTVQISRDAIPYTLYANFDKGAAGLILLAVFCSKVSSIDDIRKLSKPIIIGTICTAITVFGLALAIGYIHPDFKISAFTVFFLLINLFFVCVAEEAFFRGAIQERLMTLFESFRIMKWIAVVVSAILFGLAHRAGGITLVILSTLAGFGYALTYASTRKIESAIATHFFVNVIHFIFFTYPALAVSKMN